MEVREVLIVGAGISGCALAIALAKREIAVTLLTSSFDQRAYHAPFIQHEDLESTLNEIKKGHQEHMSCSRAYEQLTLLARQSVDELLESNYLVDRNGNIDIYRCLQEQLKQYSTIEWISNHSLIELLTLEQHSLKLADRYKKPTCLGVVAYNHNKHQIEHYRAKETILATGGASSLYPYSTHPITAYGDGIAIAHRAGVRLINMERIQFHPLGLYEKHRPCFPLPLELLLQGGQIYHTKSHPLELKSCSKELVQQLYEELLHSHSQCLWLDLTLLDPTELKEKFPSIDAYCLAHGFNIAKDPLPVVPVARYTCGGIAVDRMGQTNLQRLRAIGEVSCTGLFNEFKEEALSILESLTWAISCAEDIAKQVHKLAYYFPELKEKQQLLISNSVNMVEEDWNILREVMWSYVGISRDEVRLKRGVALIKSLLDTNSHENFTSIDQIRVFYAIQTALLIAIAAKDQVSQLNGKSQQSTECQNLFSENGCLYLNEKVGLEAQHLVL